MNQAWLLAWSVKYEYKVGCV